jgi:hypothetical protein
MMFSTNASRFFLVLAAACNAGTSAEEAVMPEVIKLGEAGNYVILAKTGISTVPKSPITGDIGVSPIESFAMTGFDLIMDSSEQFSTSSQITGRAHAASYGGDIETTLTKAVLDMQAAYSDAAGRIGDGDKLNLGAGNLGPYVGGADNPLEAGVYTFGTGITITNDIHFSGNANSVFIIRSTGVLTQAASTSVVLGDVKAENIFWQIAGNVAVGEGAHMAGILLVKTDVLFVTGSSLQGRVLAQTACNLQMATIGL